MGAAVDRTVALRRYNLGRAGISVTSQVAPGLSVRADERGLIQLLLNLVLNAEDALSAQPRKDLHISAEAVEGHVRIAVSDTGHGVSDDIRHRIFDPFFSTRTDARAVGLGLPVAQAIAISSGGRVILADGRPGSTTFVVELPAAT